MKTFNRSLRVAMSHNVVPKFPSLVFSPGRVGEDAGNEVACLVAFFSIPGRPLKTFKKS